MNPWFVAALIGFIVVSAIMVLIILVQRPSGGGLAGAFGGAGGSSTDTVFGGRVGDALTNITIVAFILYLGLAVTLSLVPAGPPAPAPLSNASLTGPAAAAGSTTPLGSEPLGSTPANPIPLGGGGDTPGSFESINSIDDLPEQFRDAAREALKDTPVSVPGVTEPDAGSGDDSTEKAPDATPDDGGSE